MLKGVHTAFCGAQIFFATVGANASVAAVIQSCPALFVFCFLQIGVHLALTLGVGGLFKFSRRDLLLASNANVGGKSKAKASRTGVFCKVRKPACMLGLSLSMNAPYLEAVVM